MSDLTRRRSHIQDIQMRQDSRIIIAVTPLAEMMSYSTALRTMTSGTSTFSMELAHYEPMIITEQSKAIQRVTGFSPAF